MAHYVITGVSTDDDGWLQHAIWREIDGSIPKFISDEQRVLPFQIAQALDRKDIVDLRAVSAAGWILANELMARSERHGQPAFRIASLGVDAQLQLEKY